jgi:UDP-glucose 4-epimerase
MKSEKILILGGAGFIGANLALRLVKEGYTVRIFSRAGRSIKNLSEILPKIELIFGDYMDEVALKKSMQGVDCVIHLISTTFPGTSIDSGAYDVFSNVIPTIRVLENCVQNNIKRLIYASSGGTIYGEPLSKTISEDHILDPKSMYGLSKKTIEGYLSFFAKNYEINVQILRISNPFGPFQNPYGAQGLIAVAFKAAIDNSTFKIFGEGDTIRDYIYIEDVIDAFLCSLKASKSDTINISSGEGKSVMDVLDAVEMVSNRKIHKQYVVQRRGDVHINILSNNRAMQIYNWSPQISFYDGLTKTWNWISEEIHKK